MMVKTGFVLAQDPTFTQFYSNPVYLNPALAGSSGCPRIALNYRNEWPQLTGNYITYSAAYDTYAKNISGGIGIIALHDQQGHMIIIPVINRSLIDFSNLLLSLAGNDFYLLINILMF